MTNSQTLPITSRELNMLEWLAEYFAQRSEGGKKPVRLEWKTLVAVASNEVPPPFQRYEIDLHDFRQIGRIDGLYRLILNRNEYQRYFFDTFLEHTLSINDKAEDGEFRLETVTIGRKKEPVFEYIP